MTFIGWYNIWGQISLLSAEFITFTNSWKPTFEASLLILHSLQELLPFYTLPLCQHPHLFKKKKKKKKKSNVIFFFFSQFICIKWKFFFFNVHLFSHFQFFQKFLFEMNDTIKRKVFTSACIKRINHILCGISKKSSHPVYNRHRFSLFYKNIQTLMNKILLCQKCWSMFQQVKY